MSEVKGEFNRTFDVSAVRSAMDGTFVFCSPGVQNLILAVRPEKKQVIDGHVIVQEHLTAFFADFVYQTRDAEVADLIRKTDAFKAGRVKELGTLRVETREKQVADAAKLLAADPDLLKAALAQLKQGKGASPEVKQ